MPKHLLSVCFQIATQEITWLEGLGSIEDWMKHMKKDGCYCDQVFLQLTSLYLNREIIIIPALGTTQIEISPHHSSLKLRETKRRDPFHVLYFSETHFSSPHYQSIRPKNGKNLSTLLKSNFANSSDILPPSEFFYKPPKPFRSFLPSGRNVGEKNNEIPTISDMIQVQYKIIQELFHNLPICLLDLHMQF